METSKTSSVVEELENVRIAATINCGYIAPSLFQLIGYRQYVAKMILSGNNSHEINVTLFSEYDYIDSNIKKILGI